MRVREVEQAVARRTRGLLAGIGGHELLGVALAGDEAARPVGRDPRQAHFERPCPDVANVAGEAEAACDRRLRRADLRVGETERLVDVTRRGRAGDQRQRESQRRRRNRRQAAHGEVVRGQGLELGELEAPGDDADRRVRARGGLPGRRLHEADLAGVRRVGVLRVGESDDDRIGARLRFGDLRSLAVGADAVGRRDERVVRAVDVDVPAVVGD